MKIGNCELKYEKYKPFEGFVCNDIRCSRGWNTNSSNWFFETEFVYPAVTENDRLWMSVTPHEIETMKEAIDKSTWKCSYLWT